MFRYVLLVLGAICIGAAVVVVCLHFGFDQTEIDYVGGFATVGISFVTLSVIFTIEENKPRD
jgi:hypothetical protein